MGRHYSDIHRVSLEDSCLEWRREEPDYGPEEEPEFGPDEWADMQYMEWKDKYEGEL